jgi:hypothetical protein
VGNKRVSTFRGSGFFDAALRPFRRQFEMIGFCFQKKSRAMEHITRLSKTAPITYDMPSALSVGSSITDVTAKPLSAWKAAIASRVFDPSTPSTAPS